MKTKSLTNKHIATSKKSLYQTLAKLDTGKNIERFLEDLCSPAELQAMIDRWQVAVLLKQAMSYREISAKTGVSTTTIGRVARVIRFSKKNGYCLAFNHLD
ncbi:MAG: YerC/YecD family TrpR-related protein [Pseudomonadota bacterium]